MSFNNRNLKLPFLATRYLLQGRIDLPLDLPISSSNSKLLYQENLKLPFCPLDASTRGKGLTLDLPICLPIEIWNCHSWQLDASTRSTWVDLPLDLPIWTLTIEIRNCHSWPLDASTGGGRSATWSAYMSFNNRNQKLPFLSTRCLYQGR